MNITAMADNGLYSPEEISKIQSEVHQTAVEKGWWERDEHGMCIVTPQRRDELMVLVVSELAEAFEEYRKPDIDVRTVYVIGGTDGPGLDGSYIIATPNDLREGGLLHGQKPEGFPIEIADAYIRILDYLGAVGHDVSQGLPTNPQVFDLELFLERMGNIFSRGGDNQLIGNQILSIMEAVTHVDDMPNNLVVALMMMETLCQDHDINLRTAIELKAAYNKSRSFRHGGKRV